MKKLFIFLVPVFGSMLIQGCCNYSCQVKKTLKEVFGRDLKTYTFRSTPVGNFGVGTIYEADIGKGKKPEDTWLLGSVSSWFKENISEEEKNAALEKIIEDGDFGTAQIGKEISNTLALDIVIPNIHSLIDAGAGVNLTNGVNVSLSARRAANRKLNWTNFVNAQELFNDETKKYIARDDIAMGAADIILEGYSARIDVDLNKNMTLNASLSKLADVGTALGNDSELSIRVERVEQGTFQISSEKPVVAAVLYLKPPKGHARPKARGSTDYIFSKPFRFWQPLVLPEKTMKTEKDRAKSKTGVR